MNWETFFNSAAALLTTAGLKILYAALILAVGLFLVRKILRLLEQGKLLRHLDKSVRSFLTSFSGIALRVLVVLAAAGVLGVPMASFVTVLASCGVAVGLALQGSLSNLAGGIMILIFKPFSVGDYIQASGQEGTVKDITILYTILEMADKRVVTLPNGTLTNAAVVNYSASPERRVDLEFRTAAEAGADALSGGPLTEFEKRCDDAVGDYLAGARYVPFGEAPLVGYLAARETEYTNLRIVLMGRAAGIDPAVIRTRLRASYL